MASSRITTAGDFSSSRGDGEPLLLAAGESVTPVADDGVQLSGRDADEVGDPC